MFSSVKFYEYKIKLRNHPDLKGERVNNRNGILLEVSDKNKKIGYGEIAPLPNFSKETLEEARKQLPIVKDILIHSGTIANLNSQIKEACLCSSIMFGVESILLDLDLLDIPFNYNNDRNRDISTALLLWGSEDAILKKIVDNRDNDFQLYKIKVGRNNIDDDVSLINTIINLSNENVKLRIDANRMWSINDALKFAEAIDRKNIDYIEEPCANFHDTIEYAKTSKLPIALDESIYDSDDYENIDCFVLKPSVIGGINKTIELVQLANKNNVRSVLSSSLESDIGLNTLIKLQKYLKLPDPPGLDTVDMFNEHTSIDPPVISNGRISSYKVPLTLNHNVVKEINT